jgi:hypothetical protein
MVSNSFLSMFRADEIGKDLTDYAGRTYMHIPTDLDVKLNPSDGAPPPNAYVPERCVHTWVRLLRLTWALADF